MRDKISDTAEYLLDIYFSNLQSGLSEEGGIVGLINSYESENRLTEVLLILANAINAPKERFVANVLSVIYPEGVPIEDTDESKRLLETLSNWCSLGIDESAFCDFWSNVRDLTTLPDRDLKSRIGEYFREKTNSYLYKNYRDTYAEILRESGFEDVLEELQKSESRSEEKCVTHADVLQFSAAPAPVISAVANDGLSNSFGATSGDFHPVIILTAEYVLHGGNPSHHEPNHQEGQPALSPSSPSSHHVLQNTAALQGN